MTQINQAHTLPRFSVCGLHLGNDPRGWVKFALLTAAIFLAVAGVGMSLCGHKILPNLIVNVESQLITGGRYLGVAAGLAAMGFIIPKLIGLVKEWRLRQYIIKNYRLVDTNIPTDGHDLKKLLSSAQAILLGEVHGAEFHREKNKTVIEGLWDQDSIFLSEAQVNDPFRTLELYRLSEEKVHCLSTWDVQSDSLIQATKIEVELISWSIKLLELQDANESEKMVLKNKMLEDLNKATEICPGLAQLKNSLENLLPLSNEKLCQLYQKFHAVIEDAVNRRKKLIDDESSRRQNSLVVHVRNFVDREKKRVFLIAGRDHLSRMNESGKRIKLPEIEDNLKGISYIVLNPKTKTDTGDETKFWQNPKDAKAIIIEPQKTGFEKTKKEINLEGAQKVLFGFSTFEDFPYQERREKLKLLDVSTLKSSGEISRFFVDANIVIGNEIISLLKNS